MQLPWLFRFRCFHTGRVRKKSREEKRMDHAAEIGTPIDVLLVEDSSHYARLIQETFRDVNANVNFHRVSDGVEAMDFLEDPGLQTHARTISFWIWACLKWMAVKFWLNSRHMTT
jgi:hypothetical protein